MPTFRPPKYSRAKEKSRADRAYVWLNGKKVWLGLFGSPKSKAKFAELNAKPQTGPDGPPEPPTEPTISELILAYMEFAATYYCKPDGTLAREYERVREAVRYLRRLTGSTLANEFGPKMLKTVRQELIDKGLSRVGTSDFCRVSAPLWPDLG